jgi:hypothetical protein
MQLTPMWGAGNLRDAEPPRSDGKDPHKSPAAFPYCGCFGIMAETHAWH